MKYIIGILLFALSGVLSAQTAAGTSSQFSLNLITPSLEYEVAVTNESTIDMDLGIGFAYHKSLGESEFGIFPGFEVHYRYYYNLQKRQDNNKKASENSGNYIAAIGSISGGDPIIGDLKYASDYGVFFGPAWGLQRVYYSKLKLNFNLGAGYGFNQRGTSYFAPIFAIQLGWKLGK